MSSKQTFQRSPYYLRSSTSSSASSSTGRGSPAPSSLFASIEEGRGTPFGRPSFLQTPPPVHSPSSSSEASAALSPEGQELPAHLQQYELPLETRRRIPGSGINHHDIFDSPIRCEVPPIEPKPPKFDHSNVENLFDQFDKDCSLGAFVGRQQFVQEHFQKKQYGRKRPSVFSSLHRTTGTGPLFPDFRSPLSSSSSSSSSFSSSSFEHFHPRASSTFISTPPRRLPSESPQVPPPPSKHFQPTLLEEQDTPQISAGQEPPFSPERNSGQIAYFPESPLPGLGVGLGRGFYSTP